MKIFMTYDMRVFIIHIFTYSLLPHGIMLLYFVRSCDREILLQYYGFGSKITSADANF